MVASPSLSHSSQNKAWSQGEIEYYQGVSDECGSGVVRVVQEHSPYLLCVLCVQRIGKCQRELQDPSTDEWRRPELEFQVKSNKSAIQQHNAAISSIDGELAKLVGERPAILNQGEPPGCHANNCRYRLPLQHVTMVAKGFFYTVFWLPWQGCCHDYQVSLPFFSWPAASYIIQPASVCCQRL